MQLVGVDLGFVPAVTVACRLPRVARLAQGLQVVLVVRATLIERQYVVNFLRRCHSAVGFTLFAERVSLDVAPSDLAPGVTVAAVNVWVALVSAVGLLMLSRMYLTVAVG